MDQWVPEGTYSQVLRSTSVDAWRLRASEFSVLKLIEIVILWVYYTIPFGFSLVLALSGNHFNFWNNFVWLRITDDIYYLATKYLPKILLCIYCWVGLICQIFKYTINVVQSICCYLLCKFVLIFYIGIVCITIIRACNYIQRVWQITRICNSYKWARLTFQFKCYHFCIIGTASRLCFDNSLPPSPYQHLSVCVTFNYRSFAAFY